jgi:hypothetical protein
LIDNGLSFTLAPLCSSISSTSYTVLANLSSFRIV